MPPEWERQCSILIHYPLGRHNTGHSGPEKLAAETENTTGEKETKQFTVHTGDPGGDGWTCMVGISTHSVPTPSSETSVCQWEEQSQ